MYNIQFIVKIYFRTPIYLNRTTALDISLRNNYTRDNCVYKSKSQVYFVFIYIYVQT